MYILFLSIQFAQIQELLICQILGTITYIGVYGIYARHFLTCLYLKFLKNPMEFKNILSWIRHCTK